MKKIEMYDLENETIAYVRVSSREQNLRGYSVDDQKRDILNYCNKNNFNLDVNNIVVDAGKSAGNLKRKGIQDILTSIPNGKIKRIVIKNNSRLTRSQINRYALDNVFDKYNIEICCLEGKWKSESVSEEMQTGVQIFFDEHQRKQVSPDTIRGMKESAQQGNWPIGGLPPRGFIKVKNKENDSVHLSPVLENTKYITYIFESLKDRSHNRKSLARLYNKHKIMGHTWTADDINTIYNNKIYCGIFDKWGLYITNHTQGFISSQLYNECHEAQKIKTRVPRHFYIYGGLVYCKECKCYCTKECSIKTNKNGEQRIYLYHMCPVCKQRINEDKIDKCIATIIDLQSLPKEKFEMISELSNKIKRKKQRIKLFEQDFDDYMLDEGEFKKKIIEIKRETVRLKNEINKIKKAEITRFKELSDFEKMKIVNKKISRIDIDFTDKEFVSCQLNTTKSSNIIDRDLCLICS